MFRQIKVGKRKISLSHTSSYPTINYSITIIFNVDITWKCILQHQKLNISSLQPHTYINVIRQAIISLINQSCIDAIICRKEDDV